MMTDATSPTEREPTSGAIARIAWAVLLVGTLARYERTWLRRDLFAGLTLWALLIPQGLAYAQLAGLPPVTGLYVGVVGLVAYALLGTSRYLTVGPESSVAIIVAVELSPLAGNDAKRYAALAGMLALLVAGFLVIGFVARLDCHAPPLVAGSDRLSGGIRDRDRDQPIAEGDRNFHGQEVPAGRRRTGPLGRDGRTVGDRDRNRDGTRRRCPCALCRQAPGCVDRYGARDGGMACMGHAAGVRVRGNGRPVPARRFPAFRLRTFVPSSGRRQVSRSHLCEQLPDRAGARGAGPRGDSPESRVPGTERSSLAAGLFHGFPANGSDSRSFAAAASGALAGAGLVAAVLVVITLVALTPLFRNLPAAALGAVVIVTAIRLVNVGELERLWRVRTPTSCWRWSRSPVSWSSES